LGFALEARQGLRITRHVVWKKLQGDEAMQPGVLGFVDHAHPAAAEFFNDAVMGDGLVDHQAQILRGRAGQVNESHGVGKDNWRNIPISLIEAFGTVYFPSLPKARPSRTWKLSRALREITLNSVIKIVDF
jgi:hypothetical protein